MIKAEAIDRLVALMNKTHDDSTKEALRIAIEEMRGNENDNCKL